MLHALFASACKRLGVPGAQLAWRSMAGDRGSIEFGTANCDTGAPVTRQTRFQIGSVTKALLAFCSHELARAGKADLDLPLARLPDLEWHRANPAFATMTPRHLMAHTSGLEGDIFAETRADHEAGERLALAFAGLPLLHETGGDSSYCNFGYVLLGRLIEHWAGKPWHQAVEQSLGGMIEDHSIACWPFPAPGDLAAGHGPHGVMERTHLALSNAAAGTSAVGTADDLARFGCGLLELARIEDPIWQAMATPPRRMARNERCIGFGQGLMAMDWSGVAVFGHDGLTIGQQAFLRIFPQTGISYALLANGGDMTGLHHTIAEALGPMIGAVPASLGDSKLNDAAPTWSAGRFERRNASLEVFVTDAGGLALKVHHHEDWARETYGKIEGPYHLAQMAPGSWRVAIEGQLQPRMLTIAQDAAYYGMRRYNRANDGRARR